MRRIIGLDAVERYAAGVGAGNSRAQHLNAIDIHIGNIVKIDGGIARLDLHGFAGGIAVQIQHLFFLIVPPLVFTV